MPAVSQAGQAIEIDGTGKYAQSITYHPNGLWSAITRPSGVQDIQDVASHGMRRPERIQVTGVAGGTAFDTGLYTYDGAGNIAAMGLDSFEYDSSSRLSAAEVHGYAQSFTYDWYGNLTSYITDGDVTSIPTDPMTNRIANPALATYDAAGNMTSLSGHTYEYDELNQLVSRDPDEEPEPG